MKRKPIFLLLVLMLLTSSGIFGAEPVLYGDSNHDGLVNSVDFAVVKRHLLSLVTLQDQDYAAADCNQDGQVNTTDLAIEKRFLLGSITSLPWTGQPADPEPANFAATKPYIPESARASFLKNGFVVVPSSANTFSSAYKGLPDNVGVLITTDSLLHLFHVTYDTLLKDTEKASLAPKLTSLIENLNLAVRDEYNQTNDAFLKESLRRLWVVTAVGEGLLRGEQSILDPGTEAIQNEANEYLSKVYLHQAAEYYPGDDYTQYLPRGHYAGDPVLERYFMAVKWLSRRIFRVKDPDDLTTSQYELVSATIMSRLIVADSTNLTLWNEIYGFTSKLVNNADSITPLMVDQAMTKLFGSEYTSNGYQLLANKNSLAKLQTELLTDTYPTAQIISARLASVNALSNKYVQFMGERFVLDGAAMQKTCVPYTSRPLPGGLDVASTIFNSRAAYEELAGEMKRYPGLQTQLDTLGKNYSSLQTAEWQKTTYNHWLYTLRALTEPAQGNVPDFMKTSLWEREKLNTMMASWTQLRHDNILYVKETGIPSLATPPPLEVYGYVEPYPLFYKRLQAMCKQVVEVIDQYHMDASAARSCLQRLGGIAGNCAGYAEKICNGTELTLDEQEQIHHYYDTIFIYFAWLKVEEKGPELVADVAFDSASGKVLHEGVGKLNRIIIRYQQPDGSYIAAVGYVLSHYEFTLSNFTRLTDDDWKTMLSTNPPDAPAWVRGYMAF